MKSFVHIMVLSVLVSPFVASAETPVDATAQTRTTTGAAQEVKKPTQKSEVLSKVKNNSRKDPVAKPVPPKNKQSQKIEAPVLTSSQISCITEAMRVRDIAQDKADADANTMIHEARWTRNTDLTAALALSGNARLQANAKARQQFQSMMKNTNEWKRSEMNEVAKTFKSTIKNSCKVTSFDQLAEEIIVDRVEYKQ